MSERRAPVSKRTANEAASEVAAVLGTLERWQKRYPKISDYRVNTALEHLRSASVMIGYLVDDIDPEGDAVRAKLKEDGSFSEEPAAPADGPAYTLLPQGEQPETGLHVWHCLADGKIIGRIDQTENGYVPVRTDSLGVQTSRGMEQTSRDDAEDLIREHFETMNGHTRA